MPDSKSSATEIEKIDEYVRRAYEELLNEEWPDRLASLLERLKAGKFPDDDMSPGGSS